MNRYGERIDASTVRFERLLPGPIERVWEYLSNGTRRATWFAGGDTELEVGGKIELRFNNSALPPLEAVVHYDKYKDYSDDIAFDGTVTQCDPPHRLAYTWNFENENSEVCFELTEVGDRVRLVLTHSKLASDREVLDVSAGWHTHLDILEDVLSGREPRPFWKTHTPPEAEYERRVR